MSKEITVTVVGVSYRVAPYETNEIEEITPLAAVLQREPENEHDENAIAVFINEGRWKGTHIGYVKRETASALAPRMDSGIEISECWLLEIGPREGKAIVKFRSTKP